MARFLKVPGRNRGVVINTSIPIGLDEDTAEQLRNLITKNDGTILGVVESGGGLVIQSSFPDSSSANAFVLEAEEFGLG
ncbi:hypothetical protein LCGC14_0421920 [marine sediment metagenome]|uniref:Uncharacterized protein n=1 Tax=marine sediment metagenome TaxID=412755 RepID=A0A0F9T8K8_9ZZZZ